MPLFDPGVQFQDAAEQWDKARIVRATFFLHVSEEGSNCLG